MATTAKFNKSRAKGGKRKGGRGRTRGKGLLGDIVKTGRKAYRTGKKVYNTGKKALGAVKKISNKIKKTGIASKLTEEFAPEYAERARQWESSDKIMPGTAGFGRRRRLIMPVSMRRIPTNVIMRH